ncbi:MAG: bifunctional UDP-N-acetylglucosamine diphosphorylase/glucosamine-1-phosphate N-acetyltransferase GlmU [Alphaproteobacteria bacterium]|nr:bifunctional UDP-N-acetylglucosamine diphosphorylase/glucosamine-1-phosphate N-acetyltransferase GlmU [Alphaproteobacteria bacterium]MBV8337734.1 bifunctional UDP-N-acetylglucosamine diphosphorylase/glucosamine-1-phosphate N-acetyltransferase GlmU [Alphaproteobacteria bacterium]
MSQSRFAAIILAAGEGKRMKSAIPKVLHPVASEPMIAHLLSALRPLAPTATVVVISRQMNSVARAVKPAETAVQDPPLGTGDAVRTALRRLAGRLAPDGEIEDILVLFGDTPLLTTETMSRLLTERKHGGAAILVSGMRPADPGPYGRLVLKSNGELERIVEAADAGAEERMIGLVNGGIMAIDARCASALVDALDRDNAKGEFYLSDIVRIGCCKGLSCRAIELPVEELIGINTRAELAHAEALMQSRLRRAAMAGGATLVAPETVFLSADTQLARDVVVEPNVTFGPGVAVEEGARILSFSYLQGARIGPGAIIGPFARLRPGAVLEKDVHIGNFVEVKAAHLGAGVKANHLSYLGDAEIGARTNIGAGTITCNYDGFNKFRTTIGEGAFIGSHTAFVAPVTVGDGAYVATGTVVVSDIPAEALTIGRAPQVDKPDRAPVLRERLRNNKR